jgi:hypothetical protein
MVFLKLVAGGGEVAGEAAYRAAGIYAAAGQPHDALKMYMTSADRTAGSPSEARALAGAAKMLAATGDRPGAEAIYHRLVQSRAAEPSTMMDLLNVLRANGGYASPAEPKEWVPVTDGPSRTAP